mmetsp:Transcript_24122/g.61250  ORF Transcript_24122/g.61250 Transcript_24122/m.61250 type:complete len:230 (-) Transcript_24122:49-738(-)
MPERSSGSGRGSSSSSTAGRRGGDREGPVRSHKVVFLGQSGTGKTSIIRQFMHGTFDDSYQATVGMDFVSKLLRPEGRSKSVRLQLWDTAGQERFRALIPGYLRDASACIVVYDITSRPSFEQTRSWVDQAQQERAPGEICLALVGNKVDLEEERAVSVDEGKALAAELGALFFEASARTAERVNAVFDELARALPAETTRPKYESDEEIILEPPRVNQVGAERPKACC